MKKLILLACLFFTTMTIIAQPEGRKGMKDKIRTLKIEFITEKLDLSSVEAEKFWPIYNVFDKAYMELRHEKLKGLKDNLKKEINMLSESEALNKLNEMTAIEDELIQLKRSFRSQLEGVISNKKILLLKIAEDGFNRRMMDRLRHRPKKK
jgi:gluconate kinase